jgi:hypothetical protein
MEARGMARGWAERGRGRARELYILRSTTTKRPQDHDNRLPVCPSLCPGTAPGCRCWPGGRSTCGCPAHTFYQRSVQPRVCRRAVCQDIGCGRASTLEREPTPPARQNPSRMAPGSSDQPAQRHGPHPRLFARLNGARSPPEKALVSSTATHASRPRCPFPDPCVSPPPTWNMSAALCFFGFREHKQYFSTPACVGNTAVATGETQRGAKLQQKCWRRRWLRAYSSRRRAVRVARTRPVCRHQRAPCLPPRLHARTRAAASVHAPAECVLARGCRHADGELRAGGDDRGPGHQGGQICGAAGASIASRCRSRHSLPPARASCA